MRISDLNPLNWHARRALQRAVGALARRVIPPAATDADRVRAAADVKVAAWQQVQPQGGAPRPPGPREVARRGVGNPPPHVPGAGYIDLAWRFLDPSEEQQRIWASEEAKYGRVTTAYGPTPQAYSSMASVGLTIERLAVINQEASRDGYLTHKADLDFEIHQKWGHLKTAHRQRVAAVFRSPLQLRPRSKSMLGRAVCSFVRGVLDDIPGFIKSEEDLLGAGRGGYSGQEVVWRTPRPRRVTVGKTTWTVQDAKGIEALEWVHGRDFRWDPIKRRMLLDAGGTRYIDPFRNPDGSPTRKLILHGGDGEGDPHQRGYAYATDLLYMLSIQSLSRWAVALELFGISTPYMQYDGDGFADDNDVADAIAFCTALGRAQPAVLHKKFGEVKVTPTPTGIDARGQHAAILGYLNSECSKCVAGQTLTMEIGGTGSYAAADTHSDSKEDVQIIDARLEADTQSHQTVRFIVEENVVQLARAFGVSPAAVLAEIPIAYRVVDRRMAPGDRANLFAVAVKPREQGGLGLPVDPDQMAEELNLRLIEQEAEPDQGRDEDGDEDPDPGPPAQRTARVAFEEDKHPRADDGKFGSGHGDAKGDRGEGGKGDGKDKADGGSAAPAAASHPSAPIHEHVDLEHLTGQHLQKVSVALDAIAKVHGDGTLKKISAQLGADKGNLGQYRPGDPPTIRLSEKAGPDIFVHELGHAIDNHGVLTGRISHHYGTSGKAGDDLLHTDEAKAFHEARQRVESEAWKHFNDRGVDSFPFLAEGAATPPYDKWRDEVLESKGVATLTAYHQKVQGHPASKRMAEYLLRPSELWARSYAQYIALRSQSPELREGIERGIKSRHQWEWEDFRPIAAAMDHVFEEIGWKRRHQSS